MDYCRRCGRNLVPNVSTCVHCGCRTPRLVQLPPNHDCPNIVFNVISLISPIGLILYLVLRGSYPRKARACAKSALVLPFAAGIYFVATFAIAKVMPIVDGMNSSVGSRGCVTNVRNIQNAVAQYVNYDPSHFAYDIDSPEELVEGGYLAAVPECPLGTPYVVKNGVVTPHNH